MKQIPVTYFDSPERSSAKQIQAEKNLIDNYPLIQNLLESFPEIALILNENRQIVACHQNAITGFGNSSFEQMLKRRLALERIFFHDVLNTAAVINSISAILHEEEGEEFDILLQSLKEASDQLIQEIQSQRDLRNAEDGNLTVDIEPVKVNEILERVYKQYSQHTLTEGKKLVLKQD